MSSALYEEASGIVSAALQADNAGNHLTAIDFYEKGVALMRQGLISEIDTSRQSAIMSKIAQYNERVDTLRNSGIVKSTPSTTVVPSTTLQEASGVLRDAMAADNRYDVIEAIRLYNIGSIQLRELITTEGESFRREP